MAKVGMEYVVFGKLTEGSDGAASYTGGKHIGPAAAFSATTNNNDVKDYGDDRTVESDVTLNNVTVSVEVNELTLADEAELLGHDYDDDENEMVTSTEDVAPFFGVGFIGKSMRNNAKVYRGVFLYKVQFKNPTDENSTKSDSTSFSHTTLEGTAFPLENHELSKKAEFSSLEDAKAWLNGLLNITA